MSFKKMLIAATAASTLVAGFAAPAFAADDVTFSYHKAELQSSWAMHRLYDRINQRAEALCSYTGRVSLEERRLANQCATDLVNDFVDGIDNRALTAMHTDEVGARRYAQNDQ